MCRTCGGGCADKLTEDQYAEINCPKCDGLGKFGDDTCPQCSGDGVFRLTSCPKEFVGVELSPAINLSAVASKGCLPVAGGTLDQANWFFDLWQTLESEQNKIEAERIERMTSG